MKMSCLRWDLNPRHSALRTDALTNWQGPMYTNRYTERQKQAELDRQTDQLQYSTLPMLNTYKHVHVP